MLTGIDLSLSDSIEPLVANSSSSSVGKGIQVFKAKANLEATKSEPSPLGHAVVGIKSSTKVYIVLHGLNNHPKVMNELVHEINAMGSDCLRLTLTGHNGNDDAEASRQAWLSDISKAVEYANKTYPDAEIHFLGFSAGGAAIINYLDRNPQMPAKQALLIAPALSLRAYAHLVRIFLPLGHIGIPAFSVAPADYRRYTFPSFKLYQALFETQAAVEFLTNQDRFKKIRLNILLADGDELISGEGIREWVINNGLADSAEVRTITFGDSVPDYKHQIIDKATVGEKNWEIVRSWLRG